MQYDQAVQSARAALAAGPLSHADLAKALPNDVRDDVLRHIHQMRRNGDVNAKVVVVDGSPRLIYSSN